MLKNLGIRSTRVGGRLYSHFARLVGHGARIRQRASGITFAIKLWKSGRARDTIALDFPNPMQTATSLPPHVLALDDDPSIRALVSD